VRLARGEGDALAGRFIHVLYDFDEMRGGLKRLRGTICTNCVCARCRRVIMPVWRQ
jgi:hypothetical protein